MRSEKREHFTQEDIREFLEAVPTVIKKAFNMVFERQRELEKKREQLRGEIKRGTRRGKKEPV